MADKRLDRRWTPEELAAVRFKTSHGRALEVIDTDTRTSPAHTLWKAKAAVASLVSVYPLVGMCRAAGLPEPVPELLFHPHRRWRFDYGFPLERIAVEIEGGVWTQGRHTRGSGFLEDMEKYNAAAILGWRVLRYVPKEMHHALGALRTLFGTQS